LAQEINKKGSAKATAFALLFYGASKSFIERFGKQDKKKNTNNNKFVCF
jgi:hypothetical protein